MYIIGEVRKLWRMNGYKDGTKTEETNTGDSFLVIFGEGKKHMMGITRNKRRMRHRIRRVFRRIACFSKHFFNYWKAFNMTFFYIKYGFV
ncbi:hypothetical protein Holit_03042 [Hollandina sp. SP2]